MKIFKRVVLVFMAINLLIHSYPQAMLINYIGYFVEYPLIVDKKNSKDYKYLKIDVKIPQIKGIANKEGEKVINNEINEKTELMIKDIEKIAKDYFGYPNNIEPIFPYQLFANYQVTNKGEILSFYIEYYQYAGGAHGITTKETYNINIKTGEKIYLKNLFKDGYDYKSVINKKINEEINKNPEYYFIGKDGFNGIKETQSYYIQDGNIIINFQAYEIAPYVTGMPEFKIPIGLFKDNLIYDMI